MDYTVRIVERKEGEKAVLYTPTNGHSSVVGRYRPSGFKPGETEYIHFDDRFKPVIEDMVCNNFVPIFIPFKGMTSTSKKRIWFQGEGIEFILDLETNTVIPTSARE